MTAETHLERYNFEQTTIIINLQILPQAETGTRQTLINLGIQDETPIFRAISLEQLQLPPLLTEMLAQLKQELPQRQAAREEQQEKQRLETLQKNYQKRQVEPPKVETPTAKQDSTSANSTTQLSLF